MVKSCVSAIKSCSCISSVGLVRRLVWRLGFHQSWVKFVTPHELLAKNMWSLVRDHWSETGINLVNTCEWSKTSVRFELSCTVVMTLIFHWILCVVHTLCREKKGKLVVSFKDTFSLYGTYEDVVQPVEKLHLTCWYVTDSAVFLVNPNKLRCQETIWADVVGSCCHKGKPVQFYGIDGSHLVKCMELMQCCCDGTDSAF